MALAAGTSLRSLPHSSIGRFEVTIVERFSWRRIMISKRISPPFWGRILSPISSINVEPHARDELGIATPFCGVPDSHYLRFCFYNGFAFGFQINGKILVRSVHAGVSKPVGDCAKVDA